MLELRIRFRDNNNAVADARIYLPATEPPSAALVNNAAELCSALSDAALDHVRAYLRVSTYVPSPPSAIASEDGLLLYRNPVLELDYVAIAAPIGYSILSAANANVIYRQELPAGIVQIADQLAALTIGAEYQIAAIAAREYYYG